MLIAVMRVEIDGSGGEFSRGDEAAEAVKFFGETLEPAAFECVAIGEAADGEKEFVVLAVAQRVSEWRAAGAVG
jgi:hypothetical protein